VPRYVAVPIPVSEFVQDYPHATGRPVSPLGFAAFGPDPVDLAERLSYADFAGMHVVLVLVDDTNLFLALAIAPDEVLDGYPPDYIKLQITDWGDSNPDDVRERVRQQGGQLWEGVLLPGGWRDNANQ
jgi:hypothetical protein